MYFSPHLARRMYALRFLFQVPHILMLLMFITVQSYDIMIQSYPSCHTHTMNTEYGQITRLVVSVVSGVVSSHIRMYPLAYKLLKLWYALWIYCIIVFRFFSRTSLYCMLTYQWRCNGPFIIIMNIKLLRFSYSQSFSKFSY